MITGEQVVQRGVKFKSLNKPMNIESIMNCSSPLKRKKQTSTIRTNNKLLIEYLQQSFQAFTNFVHFKSIN